MKFRRAALLAASLALVADAASAAASASATLSGLSVSLVSLYPSAAPVSVAFSDGNGGGVVTTYTFDSGSSTLNSGSASTAGPLSGSAAVSSGAGSATAAAAMAGDAFTGAAQASLTTTAPTAAPGGFASAIASCGLGSGGGLYTAFTLSAGALLDISGTITLTASSDLAGDEYADAGVLLQLMGFNGGVNQTSSFTSGVNAFSGSGENTVSEHFDIVFVGARDGVTTGTFFGNLTSEAGTSGALPAPEPAAPATWLAGLAVLGVATRRRAR